MTKCLYQSQVSLVSQLNIPRDELLEQLKAGKVPKLEEVDIHVSPEKLKSMVGDGGKALAQIRARDYIRGGQGEGALGRHGVGVARRLGSTRPPVRSRTSPSGRRTNFTLMYRT